MKNKKPVDDGLFSMYSNFLIREKFYFFLHSRLNPWCFLINFCKQGVKPGLSGVGNSMEQSVLGVKWNKRPKFIFS